MGIKAAQRDRLERAVSGAVLLPAEGGYADATRTWDLAAGSCPPVALVAASAADIAVGARWAKENDLDIAMLNTGHGALDHNAGALVINASRVNQAAVDSSTRRATVGPGTCWADVSAASAPLGLIGLAGASPGVGVIGYTLGSGLSPIGRTFGFASDRVVRMTVLDAECRPVRVDDQDAELFWALRGGGGLGIVTELEFGLVELSALFGGGVYFDGEDAESVLRTYGQWVEGLDERTSTSVALIAFPTSRSYRTRSADASSRICASRTSIRALPTSSPPADGSSRRCSAAARRSTTTRRSWAPASCLTSIAIPSRRSASHTGAASSTRSMRRRSRRSPGASGPGAKPDCAWSNCGTWAGHTLVPAPRRAVSPDATRISICT